MADEEIFEFLAGAEGADFDIGDGPTGDGGDVGDAAFFEVEHGDDEPVFRAEGGEGGAETFGGVAACGFVGVGGVGETFEGFWFVEWDEEGSAAFPAFEVSEAGIDGDAGDPVGEGGVEAVGMEAAPEVDEDVLAEVVEFRGALDVAGGHGGETAFAGADDGVEGGFVAGLGGADEVWGEGRLVEFRDREATCGGEGDREVEGGGHSLERMSEGRPLGLQVKGAGGVNGGVFEETGLTVCCICRFRKFTR